MPPAEIMVGQRVFVIGNPFGLDHTLTSGLVSAVDREISSGVNGRPIQGVIQARDGCTSQAGG